MMILLQLSRPNVAKRLKVLIAGAGPAGLLTANSLSLHRDRNLITDIYVYEARGDPRKLESGPRSYSLGLNIRGQVSFNTS